MGDKDKAASRLADPLELADRLQLSFVKDVIYGAVTLTLFSAFGWPQWVLALTHVLSVPCAIKPPRGGIWATAALVVTLVLALVDVVSLLTFSCGLVDCCLPGETAPAFAPTLHVCDPELSGMQGVLVTATAMVTVAVGAALSLARLIRIEVATSGGHWMALGIAYVGLRVYQLTWLVQVMMAIPALMWLISGGIVLFTVALNVRRARKRLPLWVGIALYSAAATDIALMVLALASGTVSPALQPAFYTVQTVTCAVALWLAHRASAALPAEAGGGGEQGAFKSRNLCL